VYYHIINAPPALRRFLDAREKGAADEELKELSAAATAEAERMNGRARPGAEAQLRLVVDHDE
jgi:hypothetical protein